MGKYPYRTCRRAACALLLALAALLGSCGGKTPRLTYSDGAYRSRTGEAGFVPAPPCYRATAILKESAAAVIRGFSGKDEFLYPLMNMDSALWLGAEDYTLYYSENTALPGLGEMGIDSVSLCQTGTYTVPVSRIENSSVIADLVDIYEKGASIPDTARIDARDLKKGTVPERYELVFTSAIYPGILYSLEYYQYPGEMVIYERLTDDGEIAGTYQGVRAEKEEIAGEWTAVYYLGTGLLYDRTAGCYYAIGNIMEGYFG